MRIARPIRLLMMLLLLSIGLPSLATEATEPLPSLPALAALSDQTSISGLSSGGFMAAQYHIAYSKDLIGVGVIAGGPWNCAASNPLNPFIPPINNAVSTCMDPCKYSWFGCPSTLFPNSGYLAELARANADDGHIDDPANILDDRIYIFSGRNDKTVITGVVDTTAEFYRKLGVPEPQIRYNKSVDAGHAFITDNPDDTACPETEPPYINNCGFEQAQRLLEHIYGNLNPPAEQPGGELIKFNQAEFFDSELTSMDDAAYVYVPQQCRTEACRVHVAFHGCRQGISVIGTEYVTGTGYNPVADSNGIILLYPQVKKSELSPMNPRGCWDFWGYSGNNLPPFVYYQKSAPQMQAVHRMIQRLSATRADNH
ncbi:extracellular catalytic domain type 2 short-chain-length polyhydroxyalkanoate depolymerase [Marinobacterium arenosum]|uniref:extracellular catalytic domain type 2 short-chain-length polyhydroxyalkanoate depolymerase n=1 Tax=Marinobacterium arenosum TaxID=2862496 RepID=UPI001C98481D|nr:poly(3-hydroxybutyrate) depolymerase [Marinobacterium arenosum]MBY4675883.1 poly(3-hydroxybutyrate) depolymerase [Marinobacterium arenosum]